MPELHKIKLAKYLDCVILKLEAVISFETSVFLHETTRRYCPEDGNSDTLNRCNLRPKNFVPQ
jgi:hypothetical protein